VSFGLWVECLYKKNKFNGGILIAKNLNRLLHFQINSHGGGVAGDIVGEHKFMLELKDTNVHTVSV